MSLVVNKPYPVPDNEAERLAEVAFLGLLADSRDPTYDHFVVEAAALYDAPIAAVTVLDADRQVFKAAVGLDADGTSREVAFCAHTILGRRPFVIPDASADDRFRDNPFVAREHGLRFYAGVPLVTSRGLAVGALCVVDTMPRWAGSHRLGLLEKLARQVIEKMEKGRQAGGPMAP